ncbi:MAG TPA: response regulator [Pyrinomonadaceae bacterium]|nr:response regulator [Pyrinomonadaceae bacterium]
MSSNRETADGTPQTILVVDNMEGFRRMVSVWLAQQGYRVAEAEDGRMAIEEARRVFPDLILMDLKMPGVDGIGAAESIRQDAELMDVPIVAVTGDNTEYCKSRAREAGFNDYLVKPFEAKELRNVLDRHLPQTSAVVH